MITKKNSFSKTERLHLRKDIELLFKSGSVIKAYPFNGIYRFVDDAAAPLQMAVGVPKRIFKKAVTRNRIKRQVREAFRLNSHAVREALEKKGRNAQVMFVFTGKEPPDYAVLTAKIILILQRLQEDA